jgi:hypothetical protein
MKIGLALGSAAVALLMGLAPALAVEGGLSPYAKGFSGFMSGFVPPEEGLYASDIYYYFHGSVDAEVRNGRAEFDIDTTLNVDFLVGTYVTDFHILGGQYAFGAAVGWAWADLAASLSTPLGDRRVSLDTNGFSDMLITPVILGWHEGNFHWSFTTLVYAPTGHYSTSQLSVSKNIWAFMPQFAITYFDLASGWEASAAIIYVTMSRNDTTDYQSGDVFHVDWGIGKHFGPGLQWEAGIVGNVVQQVGADRGTGAKLGPLKAESFGLGPSISYNTKIGKSPLSLSVKWEHDITSHNTFGGDVVSASANIGF